MGLWFLMRSDMILCDGRVVSWVGNEKWKAFFSFSLSFLFLFPFYVAREELRCRKKTKRYLLLPDYLFSPIFVKSGNGY